MMRRAVTTRPELPVLASVAAVFGLNTPCQARASGLGQRTTISQPGPLSDSNTAMSAASMPDSRDITISRSATPSRRHCVSRWCSICSWMLAFRPGAFDIVFSGSQPPMMPCPGRRDIRLPGG
jgi:hypothetical protein